MDIRTAARRATTALLCGVVLVALGLAFIGLPSDKRAPESLSVALDFDTFRPGVMQTRTSDVEIPVPSRVTDAEIVQNGVDSNAITVDMTICDAVGSGCRPLVAGLELEQGPHTLTVDATLTGDVPPGARTTLVGQVRIVEARSTSTVDTTLLVAVAGGGLLAIAAGALLVRPRHGVMT